MDAWHGIAWHHVAMFFGPFGSGEARWEALVARWEHGSQRRVDQVGGKDEDDTVYAARRRHWVVGGTEWERMCPFLLKYHPAKLRTYIDPLYNIPLVLFPNKSPDIVVWPCLWRMLYRSAAPGDGLPACDRGHPPLHAGPPDPADAALLGREFFFFFSLSSSLRSVYSAILSLMLIVLGVEVEVGVVASVWSTTVACGF